MKHIFGVAILFLLPFFAYAEEMVSFASDVSLNENGTFIVIETIEYDFGSAQRHGIYRDILKQHPQDSSSVWKDRYLDIDIQAVSLDGGAVPYMVDDGDGQVSVRIGDGDHTIQGIHTYVISYLVTGGYSYFEDGSVELYWNATGNGWNVPIRKAEATLHAPLGLLLEQRACYSGAYGENTPCQTIVATEDGSVTFAATDIAAYGGLTFAQELNGQQLRVVITEKWKWWIFGLLLAPLLLLGTAFAGYKYKTKYRTGRPIIAQYEPYENFKPMYAGMLFDDRLDPRDITAGIVYLAQQGFLKIKKTDQKVLFLFDVDDYVIELLRPISEIESTHLKDVAELLFSEHAQPGAALKLSDLKKDIQKQQENALALQKLRSDLKKDMKTEGFYQTGKLFTSAQAFVFVCMLVLIVMLQYIDIVLSSILFLCSIVIVGIHIVVYERRTRRGYEALDHLKGFKLFLSMTEKERYAFHNAPQKSPEQFMEYLPYAIAFGVEKQWAEVFKDITIPNPGWYDAGSAGNFSAINLTNSLGGFSTAMAASAVSSASSSGGSGGGGSSGGGGGGGGGGSW